MQRVSHACIVLPLVSYLYVVLFWLLASASQGDWIRPNIDDPAAIGFGIPMLIHGVLLLASFSVLPVVCVIGYKRGMLLWHFLSYMACLSISVVLFRMDFFRITSWITD